ncbi:transposase [Paenibacillus sp. MMS18-CY102]|uniref:transposase n=1 Tax=Paenibacillus sp. MMS18-CY102 TaxID=2682849 RepID=UPI003FA72FA7
MSLKRWFRCPIESIREYVAKVVSGYRMKVVARKHGFSSSSLRKWLCHYRDEVDVAIAKKH